MKNVKGCNYMFLKSKISLAYIFLVGCTPGVEDTMLLQREQYNEQKTQLKLVIFLAALWYDFDR